MHHIQTSGLAYGVALSVLSIATVQGQGHVVSPPSQVAADELEFSTSLPLLHNTPRRSMQIHSDLKGIDVSFTRLALRRDQTSSAGTGTRRVDCALFLGDSVSYDQPRWVFLANYTGPRTQVMGRRFVDLPVLTSVSNPAGFELALTFDVPWRYAGLQSFAWEMSVFQTERYGTYARHVDAYGSSAVTSESVQIGLGCYATGMASPMTHSISTSDCGGVLSFGGSVDSMPASAACLLMLGLANPNYTIPGLCSPIYTDVLVALPLGASDATGFLGENQYGDQAPGGMFAFAVPNTFPGATVYSQVHALDVGSASPFQLANSDGRSWVVPTSDRTRQNRVTRLYNDDSQPEGLRAVWVPDRNVGFGAVVRFEY